MFIGFLRRSEREYIVSGERLLYLFIIGIGLLYHRVTEVVWVFVKLESIKIAYFDLYFWYFFLLTILYFTKRRNKRLPVNSKGFMYDNPSTKDSLGRKRYAESIAATILKTSSDNQAFAIGITGSWGSGKTSFLGFIETAIKNKESSDTIILRFNPWMFDDKASLIDDFFNVLKTTLRPFNPELSNQLAFYSNQITFVGSNFFTKLAKTGLQSISKEKNIDDLFAIINETIAQLNKKVIIFVDDLDRLDKKELLETIKLIRKTANFNNFFFVVAYDQGYVNSAIKDLNEYNHSSYLEKVFQLELSLPPVESRVHKFHIIELLKRILDEDEYYLIDQYFPINPAIINIPINGIDPITLLSSIRDCNRLINSFLISYENVKHEVVFEELLNIEILRLKFPDIYGLLATDRESLLTTFDQSTATPIFHSSRTYLLRNEAQEKIKTFGYSTEESEVIFKLLEEILGQKNTPSNHMSIAYPEHFEKYFYLRLMDNDLSEVDFSNARLIQDQVTFNAFLENLISKGLARAFYDRLLKFRSSSYFSSKADFEQIIRGVIYLGNIKGTLSMSPTNFRTLFELGRDLYNQTPEEYKDFLKTILEEAKADFEYEIDIYPFINDFIDDDEKKEIYLNYFTELTGQKQKLEPIIWSLFRFFMLEAGGEPIDIDNNIKHIFKNFISEKDPLGFFILNVHQYGTRTITIAPAPDDLYRIEEQGFWRFLFDDLNAFKALLVNSKETFPGISDELDEAIDFLTQYQDRDNPIHSDMMFHFRLIDIYQYYRGN